MYMSLKLMSCGPSIVDNLYKAYDTTKNGMCHCVTLP